MRMCQDSICLWSTGHCSRLALIQHFLERKDSSRSLFLLPCPALFSHCLISVMGTCFSPFCLGLMAGLRGLASHGSSRPLKTWLPIIEAPGHLRGPTSTLLGSLLIVLNNMYTCTLPLAQQPLKSKWSSLLYYVSADILQTDLTELTSFFTVRMLAEQKRLAKERAREQRQLVSYCI